MNVVKFIARIAGLFAVLVFAVAGGYLGYNQLANARPASAAAVTYRFSPVQRGNLAATVASTGSLVPNNQAKLSFQAGGKLAELDVKVGDVVKAGAVLARLDTTNLQMAVDQAQLSLQNAQAALEKLNNTNYQAPVDQAQLSLQNAQLNLAKLQAGPTATSITIAKDNLDKAAIVVQNAQAAYDKISWRGNVGMTQEAQALQSATIDYQTAQANYQQALTGNTTAQDIQVQQNAVKLAQSQVDQAKITLANSAQDKITQQGAVKLAQLQLDQAKTNLQNATLVAPFAATVAAVSGNVGENVSASPLVTLVDLNSMHVETNIDETDISKVQVGQTVNITFDSLSGVTIPAKVTAIAPNANIQSGVVTYLVYVVPQQTDARLRAGLTSTADIVVDQRNNVLYVPNRAIKNTRGVKTVTVPLPDGTTVEKQVQTGLSNDTNTEIVAGLADGDMVGIATTATNQPAAAGGAGLFGGGLGGGVRVAGPQPGR